jgi:hypothetical protein
VAIRDADGQIVIRAQHLRERIVIDGKLEESFCTRFQPASGFVQVEPAYGEAATEQTEVWVFFDERNIAQAVISSLCIAMAATCSRAAFRNLQNRALTIKLTRFFRR